MLDEDIISVDARFDGYRERCIRAMHNSWLRVNSAASTYTQVRDRTGDVPCGHSREGVSNQGLADKNGLAMDTSIHFSFFLRVCANSLSPYRTQQERKCLLFLCLWSFVWKHRPSSMMGVVDRKSRQKTNRNDNKQRLALLNKLVCIKTRNRTVGFSSLRICVDQFLFLKTFNDHGDCAMLQPIFTPSHAISFPFCFEMFDFKN